MIIAKKALVFVTDTFVRTRDAGQITGAVLEDISKGFDKVRHQVLINDLFEVGMSGSALVWFADYLSNRRQIEHIAENCSPPFSCMCAVPRALFLVRCFLYLCSFDPVHYFRVLCESYSIC